MFAHRAVTARSLHEPNSPNWLEQQQPPVPSPRSYACQDTHELIQASKLLSHSEKVVLKPVETSDGRGVVFLNNNEEELRLYDFNRGPIILEEYITVDSSPDGLFSNRSEEHTS